MNIFGYNLKFSGNYHFGQPQDPERDWRIIMTLALVVLVVFLIVSVWLFFQVRSGNLGSTAQNKVEPPTSVLHRQALENKTDRYRQLRSRYELMQDSQPDIPNPAR